MYPTLTDFLYDLFGFNLPLPIQTFGFVLALSFLGAAYTLTQELKRKENLGILKPITIKTFKGAPASPGDLFSAGLFGFLFGFKFIYGAMNYSELVENPQELMLSMKGNWIAGIALAALMMYLRYREKEKDRLAEPVETSEIIHPYQMIANITMVAAVSGILGSKLFHILENLGDFYDDPWGNIFSFSGLTFYGGLICGAISVLWYTKSLKIPHLQMVDATGPGLMFAYGFGRLGCHFSGDGDWGIANISAKPSWLSWAPDWLWSYNYAHNVNNVGVPIPGCVGKHCFMLDPPVFPTPLYEFIFCMILFFFLWSIRKKINSPGVLFSIYLFINGIERLLIEQIRVNNILHLGVFHFTQAQFISSALIIIGIAGIFYFSRKKIIDEETRVQTSGDPK